ncbi:MAG TPA: 2-C-methyl-D-erythritol 2,4-cyclodiphosphate synthase [Candidatus Limnocylindrales bacterium]|nr:2-C-methyl-D-erythritol 2,4-cyclodiphosphate synthase [Candidatus Limnocylindrales bacterium]
MSAPVPFADAVVVAAGSSTRMAGIDKLAHEVAGRPLLAWSIDALAAADVVERIVLVAAPDRLGDLRGAPWLDERVVAVVAGGDRRHESVAAGLAALEGEGHGGDDRVVLVHDGARPMPTPGLVWAVAHAAAAHGAAIPVVPVTDTLKRLAGDLVAETVDRSAIAAAQTPQGARASLLRAAFERFPPTGPEAWTDEAALLEACRIPVHALPGEPTNLKVTVPADLARVEVALTQRLGREIGVAAVQRVGTGLDSHPFGPGAPLVLGGVEIPGAPRLHGHSDGDVALHAVADALLGAAGLGDLGRLFPPTPATPRGIASGELLAAVVARLAGEGLAPRRVDLTVVGARPRLAAYLDAMRDAIADRLGIEPSAVSVKASTGNLGGDEGAGRSMSALAVAVVGPAR